MLQRLFRLFDRPTSKKDKRRNERKKKENMKATSEMRVMNIRKQVLMTIGLEDLERVRYVVDRASQEFQWFHRVEKTEDERYVRYHLHGIYIPPQYTSYTEVETTSEFQLEYYKHLKDKYGGALEATKIIRESGAWCHSHHSMPTTPSGTDTTTFNKYVEETLKLDTPAIQIMLIFNKKEEFYCRLWDPELGTFENPPLVSSTNIDFTELSDQMKWAERKKPVTTTTTVVSNTSLGNHYSYQGGESKKNLTSPSTNTPITRAGPRVMRTTQTGLDDRDYETLIELVKENNGPSGRPGAMDCVARLRILSIGISPLIVLG